MWKCFFVIGAVRQPSLSVELCFRDCFCRYEALVDYQTDGNADREGASAEAESKNFVFLAAKVAARELISEITFRRRPIPNAPPRRASGANEDVPTPSS